MMDNRLVKLVERVLDHPKDVSFADLSRVLEGFGYQCRQPRGGSSHYVFRKPGHFPISIPKERPVKRRYVEQVITLLRLEEWYETNH